MKITPDMYQITAMILAEGDRGTVSGDCQQRPMKAQNKLFPKDIDSRAVVCFLSSSFAADSSSCGRCGRDGC